MTKRITSFVLSISLVLSMLSCWSSISVFAASADENTVSASSPAEVGATASQQNIVARAEAVYKCTWTAAKDVKGWRDQNTFTKGTTHHLPYGQPATTGRYIGFGVSFTDFLTATMDSGSIFYTSRSNYAGKYSTYYATDCSAFVSYCWGVGRNTTATLPYISTDLGKANSTNIQKLQIGDALNYSSSHVVLVTNIVKNSSGTITSIEITEQTPPEIKRTTYTAAELASKYSTSYSILRYSGSVAAPTYTFSFDANGGSGTMANSTMTWGTSSNIPANKFTKTGYQFNGWQAHRESNDTWRYTNGTTTGWYKKGSQPSGYTLYKYKDKASVSSTGLGVSDTVTLKATWEKVNTTFTLVFDANGGTGTMANQQIEYGVDTKINANKFTYDGYEFKGWYVYRNETKQWRYKNNDGETGWYTKGEQPAGYFKAKYNDQATISKTGLGIGDTVKLTAVWGGASYKVEYKANGGTGTMSNASHIYGVEKALATNTFTKSKHTFAGWALSRKSDDKMAYTLAEGGSVKWYVPGTQADGYRLALYSDMRVVTKLSSKDDDVITATAQWTPNTTGTKTFYIDYNANGGTGTMKRTTVVKGTSTATSECTFTKPGYKFAGWRAYRKSDDTWRMKDANGNVVWCNYNERPTGYDDFSLYKNGGNVANTSAVDCDIVTFYAVWEEDFKFTFVFDANGGEGTMPNQTVAYGVDTKINANKFTKAGYKFAGWNLYKKSVDGWYYTNGTDSGYYAKDKQPSGYYLGIYEDQKTVSKTGSKYDDVVTLYAVWEEDFKFTFVFDANGGEGTMPNQTVAYGVKTKINANQFKKEGYKFVGWNLYKKSADGWNYTNGTDTGYYAKDKQPSGYYLGIYEDQKTVSKTGSKYDDVVTLYAVWEKDLLIGDANQDGRVSIEDATLIQLNIVNDVELSGDMFKICDANADGSIDIKDVTMIQRYIAELVSSLG